MSKENVTKVTKKPLKFGAGTLCRLMDDCLPSQIEDERDMQALIDKLWPALVVEHEVTDGCWTPGRGANCDCPACGGFND